MKGFKSLRDARHFNKYIYTLSDELFYEPFDTSYSPSQEYLELVTDLLNCASGWKITRDGFWFHAHRGRSALPIQGWKVHVSATLWNSEAILSKAARIALSNDVPFKFALDKSILSLLGFKRWQRGGSGKFITMYPVASRIFTSLLEQLYEELRSEEGPYVLSDRRYRDCKVLYYRYGGMAPSTQIDVLGKKVPILMSPTGEAVPDIRTPYFSPPDWEIDPFSSRKSKYEELTLRAGRYVVRDAMAFSNSGGVYLAEDRRTGAEVVIKEARAHTVPDIQGNDAAKRLKKEEAILASLQSTGVAPKSFGLFQEWENIFLAEEYIDGLVPRAVMITQSPLLKVRPSLEDSSEYYEHFKQMFRSLIQTIELLHERGIVFGDLSHTNLIIDPTTYSIRLIDFECAFRPGLDEPTGGFTPGYRSAANTRKFSPCADDDFYAMAAIMLYMLFPVAVLSSLRSDLFDSILKTLLADIGWSQTNIFAIISGLSKHELTCADACSLLDKPAKIMPPSFAENADTDSYETIIQDLGHFILKHLRIDENRELFPSDPFMYQTNPLSLGFGACGVLYALKKCGFDIPKTAYEWLKRQLDRVRPEEVPPGLLTGSSGISLSLWELGLEDRAIEMMKMANESTIRKSHHSYLYGMAGTGMANLYLYRRTGNAEYLSVANELADTLLRTAQEDNRGIYWEAEKSVYLGYGYGQSGVALFFLRLHQLVGRPSLLEQGRRALEFDLSHGVELEKGVLSFPNTPTDTTLLPYLEEGAAGIAKVAIRYGMWEQMDMMLAEVHRKYAGFAGLLYGLSSFVDVLTDAYLFSGKAKFLDMARRPIAGIMDLYLLKQKDGLATPGDGLFRISCDYATGVAGVMRTLHRFSRRDAADFVLDEDALDASAFGAARPDELYGVQSVIS